MNERSRVFIRMAAVDAGEYDGVAVCSAAAGMPIDDFLFRDLSPALKSAWPLSRDEAVRRVEMAEKMIGCRIKWLDGHPQRDGLVDNGPEWESPGSRWRT